VDQRVTARDADQIIGVSEERARVGGALVRGGWVTVIVDEAR